MELMGKASEILAQVKNESENYLKTTLNEVKEVVFDVEEDFDIIPCVTYDGGNHPEYAAYPYAEVKRVFLNDKGDVRLDVDDEYGYHIERLASAEETYAVAMGVYEKLNREKSGE